MTQIEAGSIQPFEAFFGQQQETGLVEAEDRRQLTTKVRDEYVRLLNQYGHSIGIVQEVRTIGHKCPAAIGQNGAFHEDRALSYIP